MDVDHPYGQRFIISRHWDTCEIWIGLTRLVPSQSTWLFRSWTLWVGVSLQRGYIYFFCFLLHYNLPENFSGLQKQIFSFLAYRFAGQWGWLIWPDWAELGPRLQDELRPFLCIFIIQGPAASQDMVLFYFGLALVWFFYKDFINHIWVLKKSPSQTFRKVVGLVSQMFSLKLDFSVLFCFRTASGS